MLYHCEYNRLQLRKREMGCGQAPPLVFRTSLQTVACFYVGVQVNATQRLRLRKVKMATQRLLHGKL